MTGLPDRDPLRLELGHLWLRTDCTTMALYLLGGDLGEMSALADDVNAAVLDATGLQVCMQANGWATVPAGADPGDVEESIDRALASIREQAVA